MFKDKIEDFKLNNPIYILDPGLAKLNAIHKNLSAEIQFYPGYIKNYTNLTVPYYNNKNFSRKIPHSYAGIFYNKTDNASIATTFGYMQEILIRQMQLVITFLEDYRNYTNTVFTQKDKLNKIIDIYQEKTKKSFYLSAIFYFVTKLLEIVSL